MPLVVATINGFTIYFFMKFAMDFRTFDYGSFLRKYGERFLGRRLARPMQMIYEFNFNWLLIVCMALAYSTSGSALQELTGIPHLITTFIVGIIMLILCMKGTELVRKNAVFMSIIIFVTLLLINVPNMLHNVLSGNLSAEIAMIREGTRASSKGIGFYLAVALIWAYIFSGQNLGGFGAYVNHADIFDGKKTLRAAVILSVLLNYIFLELSVINLAANYSAIYSAWGEGKAVYSILVVKNGLGSAAYKNFMLIMLTIAIFFATISTAINYVQGFNDRVLNWYERWKKEDRGVSLKLRNRRGTVLVFAYICMTWCVSQFGLTALVSKGLTLVSYITLFILILPTIINVCIGWEDREENSDGR